MKWSEYIMEFEKYIIEVGVRSIKYLGESASSYNLTDKLQYATQFNSKEQAEHLFNVPCLKGKQIRIKKLIFKLED